MNEAGLVIEEMSLAKTVFPPSRHRPTLSQTEWIQYQLDNFATVRDVIKQLNSVGVSGWGWHFLIADASGDCASVEFINGEAVTARNSGISGCVLTNDSFAEASNHLRRFQGFGGKEHIPETRDSLSRFVRAADLLQRDAHPRPADDVAFGFDVLGAVDQGKATQRSIVYEVTARRLHFRTHDQRAVKTIDFSRLDLTRRLPTQMLDIESPLSGDVTAALTNYTAAENRRVVESFVQLVHATGGAADLYQQDLKQAGLTEAQYIELVVNHPDGRARNRH
jgi:choloylglycine hydrolase